MNILGLFHFGDKYRPSKSDEIRRTVFEPFVQRKDITAADCHRFFDTMDFLCESVPMATADISPDDFQIIVKDAMEAMRNISVSKANVGTKIPFYRPGCEELQAYDNVVSYITMNAERNPFIEYVKGTEMFQDILKMDPRAFVRQKMKHLPENVVPFPKLAIDVYLHSVFSTFRRLYDYRFHPDVLQTTK